MLDQAVFHWIQVNVVDFLHKGRFARDQKRVGMMLPNGVLVAAFLFELAQFVERLDEIIFLQIIDDPPCRNAVEITQRLRRLTLAVGDDVFMVGHYRVSENTKLAGFAGFIECVAGDLFEFVGLKDRQPVMRHRRKEVAWRVYRNSCHFESIWRRSLRRLRGRSHGEAQPFRSAGGNSR